MDGQAPKTSTDVDFAECEPVLKQSLGECCLCDEREFEWSAATDRFCVD